MTTNQERLKRAIEKHPERKDSWRLVVKYWAAEQKERNKAVDRQIKDLAAEAGK